jgi:hypothetical protein
LLSGGRGQAASNYSSEVFVRARNAASNNPAALVAAGADGGWP